MVKSDLNVCFLMWKRRNNITHYGVEHNIYGDHTEEGKLSCIGNSYTGFRPRNNNKF
jgi:hypothetical protein